jgi:hypothetical protein
MYKLDHRVVKPSTDGIIVEIDPSDAQEVNISSE